MKTFSRETFDEARAAWAGGEFGSQWAPVRQAAVERGFIFPPAGSPHDDRDDEHPSQRAIVWRAIIDNPDPLLEIIGRSRSWSDVVAGIVGLERQLRADADQAEAIVAADRAARPSRREATTAMERILGPRQAPAPDRAEIRAAISTAYYEARNRDLTMEDAADMATTAVLALIDRQPAEAAR